MSDLASRRLLDLLGAHASVTVVTHDNPDPDAIATGWAIQWLVEQKLKLVATLIGGGEIIRAENRRMVELLGAPIACVAEAEIADDAATVLVDCSPRAANHLLGRAGRTPLANLDHHASAAQSSKVAFQDIRADVLACASIAAGYLREQRLSPPAELATALLYALETEAQGGQTRYSELDRAVVQWLTGFADLSKLAQINDAPLTRDYFGDLTLALQNTFLYGDIAVALLVRAEGAEVVGEVADLLVRCREIKRVLCAAHVADKVHVSVRTVDGEVSAERLIRKVLRGLGHGGGHERRAGGFVPAEVAKARGARELDEELRARWLDACGNERRRGRRLVARKEIVGSL